MRGESSAVRTVEREVKAEFMSASGAWKAGDREEIIEGVRRRMAGLTDAAGGVEMAWRCGCVRGRIWRSGRKD